MDISSPEAEQALAAIEVMATKTRQSIANSGTYATLIATGIVWLIGFTCQQFLPEDVAGTIWIVLSVLGTVLGFRLGGRIRSPATAPTAKRIGIFWLLLILYGVAAIIIAGPTDGKKVTVLIVLFIMIGQLAMGLLFSFSSVWWALPITALALVGYFWLPGVFYLWMAILGGGGMIVLGLYIRARW